MASDRLDPDGHDSARFCQSVVYDLSARNGCPPGLFAGFYRCPGFTVYRSRCTQRAFGRPPFRSDRFQACVYLCSSSGHSLYGGCASSVGKLDFFICLLIRIFYSGHYSAGGCLGTKIGPPGEIHGLQPDDGARLWHGRIANPSDRKAGGYVYDPAGIGRNRHYPCIDRRAHCLSF